MKRFQTQQASQPTIPTSSLPDIIFILLFFFMVVTVVRPHLLVERVLPEAEQLQKLQKDHQNIHLYLGQVPATDNMRIQMNGMLLRVVELDKALYNLTPNGIDENQVVIVEADQETKMDFILQVQGILRRHGLRKIVYYSKPLPNQLYSQGS